MNKFIKKIKKIADERYKKYFSNTPVLFKYFVKFQPLFSLISSLICIFLLKRGFEYIPAAVTLLVISLSILTLKLFNYTIPISTKITDFAAQMSLSNILVFILPFYIESITPFSRNMLFAPIIIFIVIIINWIKLYNSWVINKPLAGSIYYAVAFFSAFNFIFPVIFGMRNLWSLLASGTLSGVIVLVMTFRKLPWIKNRENLLNAITGVFIAVSLLWLGRSFIPPAPLNLKYSTACEGVELYAPVNPFNRADYARNREIYFYSRIFAPRGLSEEVHHVWRFNGKKLLSINIKEIHGGRKEGFATWSRHSFLEGTGEYSVEVWTAGGQLLGEKKFFIKNTSSSTAPY